MKTDVKSFDTLLSCIKCKDVTAYVITDGVERRITRNNKGAGIYRLSHTDSSKFSLVNFDALVRMFNKDKESFSVWFNDPMDANMHHIEDLCNEIAKDESYLSEFQGLEKFPLVRKEIEQRIKRHIQEADDNCELVLATLNGRSFYQYEQDQLAALITKNNQPKN